jgi:hypothetical protein
VIATAAAPTRNWTLSDATAHATSQRLHNNPTQQALFDILLFPAWPTANLRRSPNCTVSRILTVAARLASKQAQTAAVKEGGFPQNNISKSEHISVLIDAARRLLYRNAAWSLLFPVWKT